MLQHQNGMRKTVINPRYKHLTAFIERLPQNFAQEGCVIYNERNCLKVFQEQGLSLCVKSFHVPFFINQIAYGFLRLSKARRSYEYGMKLLERNVNTPEPIAYIEHRQCGLLKDSYYISINQLHTGLMREFERGPLAGREDLLAAFAHFTAHTHDNHVLHKDFSPGNILYLHQPETGYSFYLIDINRMEFREVDMQEGCRCFRRLWGSNAMIAHIAREYALARGFDPQTCIDLSLKHHAVFWKRYSRKYPDRKPYYVD